MSNPVFLAVAAFLVALALAFTLAPLLGRSRHTLMLALVALMSLGTAGLYALIGTPTALDGDGGEAAQIRTALAGLADRALSNPDEPAGWTRLGLAYKQLEEFSSAEHAFRRALFVDSDNDMVKVELAETLLYASGRRQLPEEARSLLTSSLGGEAAQKALWLLGLDTLQREDYTAAAAYLERLLALLPNGSSVHQTVAGYLEQARSRSGPSDNRRAPEPEASPSVDVDISVAEELAGRLSGDETVFVILRGAGEGAPPLAVRRLTSSELPGRVRLGGDHAMMPGRGLANAGEVTVIVRVSFSGNAAAAPGDLEGRSNKLVIEDGALADVHVDEVL